MNVLFVTKMDFGLRQGGVQIQVQKTAQALRDEGVNVRLFNPWEDSLRDIDVCHIFVAAKETQPYASAANALGIPVVVSPVFNMPGFKGQAREFLSRYVPGFYLNIKAQRRLLVQANRVLPLTNEEHRILQRMFGISNRSMQVIPNGVDEVFFRSDEALFVSKYGFRPDVLFVGRLDTNKNVLGLISALQDTNLRLAIIGAPYIETPEVHAAVCRLSSRNVVYLGSLPNSDPLLPSAYAASRVFCLPSHKEVMPLSVLEAAASGCRIAVTENTCMTDLLKDKAEIFNPTSSDAIRNAIQRCLQKPVSAELQSFVRLSFNWRNVARTLIQIYETLAADRDVHGVTIPESSHSRPE